MKSNKASREDNGEEGENKTTLASFEKKGGFLLLFAGFFSFVHISFFIHRRLFQFGANGVLISSIKVPISQNMQS